MPNKIKIIITFISPYFFLEISPFLLFLFFLFTKSTTIVEDKHQSSAYSLPRLQKSSSLSHLYKSHTFISIIINYFYYKLISTLNIKTFFKFVKMRRNNKKKKEKTF